MKIEIKEGSTGSIDPWTLEKLISDGKTLICSDDMAIWVRVNDKHIFRVLEDTESRINSGEDPKKVLMDALEFWRPGMKTRKQLFGHTIEIGTGEVDPKTRWDYISSGQSYLTTNSRLWIWIYYDNCPPFPIDDYYGFLRDLGSVKGEKELEELITLWTWK